MEQGFLGTIGYIKANLMSSPALQDKGYSNENFYPGATNIPDSEPTRPDGIPPVTDGLVVCVDGNVNNGFANLVESPIGIIHEGSRTTKTDTYGIYYRYGNQQNCGLKLSNTKTEYEKDGVSGRSYILVARLEYKAPEATSSSFNQELVPRGTPSEGEAAVRLRINASQHAAPYYLTGEAKTNGSSNKTVRIEIADPALKPHVYSARYTGYAKSLDSSRENIYCKASISYDLNHASTEESKSYNVSKRDSGASFNYAHLMYEVGTGYVEYKHLYAAYIYDRPLTDDELNKVIKYAMTRYKIG